MHPLQNSSTTERSNTSPSFFPSLPRCLHRLFSSCTGAGSDHPTRETMTVAMRPARSLATQIERFSDSGTREKLFLAAAELWGNESLDQPTSFTSTRCYIIQKLGKKDPADMEAYTAAAKLWHTEAPTGANPDCWTQYFLSAQLPLQELQAIQERAVKRYQRFITTFPEQATSAFTTNESFFKLLNTLLSCPTEQYERFLSAISAISTSLTPPDKKDLLQSLDKLCLSASFEWALDPKFLDVLEGVAEMEFPMSGVIRDPYDPYPPIKNDSPIFHIHTLCKQIEGPDAPSHIKAILEQCKRLLIHPRVGGTLSLKKVLTTLSRFSDHPLRERFVSEGILLIESTAKNEDWNKSYKSLICSAILDCPSDSRSGYSTQGIKDLELTRNLIQQLYPNKDADRSAISEVHEAILRVPENLRDQFLEVVRIRRQLLNENPLSSLGLRGILDQSSLKTWSQEISKYTTAHEQAFDMVRTLSVEQRIPEAEAPNYLSTFTHQLYYIGFPPETKQSFIDYVMQACRLLPANTDFKKVIPWMARMGEGRYSKIEDWERRVQGLMRTRAAQGEGVHEEGSDEKLRSAIKKFFSVAVEKDKITEALQAFQSYLEKYPKQSDRELALRALSGPKMYTNEFPYLLDPQGFTILGLPLQGSELIGRLWLFISQLPDERDQENAKVSMVSALKESYEIRRIEEDGQNAEVRLLVCSQGKTRRLCEGVLSGRFEGIGRAPIEHKVLENDFAVMLFFQNEAHQQISDWDELIKTAEEFAKNPMVEKEGFIKKIKEFAALGEIFQRTEISVGRFWATAEHRGIEGVKLLAAAETFCAANPEVEKEAFMTAVKQGPL